MFSSLLLLFVCLKIVEISDHTNVVDAVLNVVRLRKTQLKIDFFL
jgi:hypothetical protein